MIAFLFIILTILYVFPSNELRLLITIVMSIVWLVILPFYTIYIYYKYDKEYKSKQDIYYSNHISTKRTPIELCYLMTNKIYPRCVTATIMALIKKQIFIVDRTKHNLTLIYDENHSENLLRSETFLIHWLMKRIGNGKQVSLTTILNEYGLNRNYFFVSYREWVNLAMVECVKENFFEKRSDLLQRLYAFVAIGFILFVYNIIITSNAWILIITLFISALLFTLYISNFYKRTVPANEEYLTWKAFGQALNNYNTFDDKDSIEYLEECAIYAYVLGKIIPFKYLLLHKFHDKIELIKNSTVLNMVINDDIIRLGKTIESCIKKSVIRESIFER